MSVLAYRDKWRERCFLNRMLHLTCFGRVIALYDKDRGRTGKKETLRNDISRIV